MKAEYKRELNGRYLILEPEQPMEPESYSVRMLEAGNVPALLPCHVQMVDGKQFFYYNVTGKQAAASRYEGQKITAGELRTLLGGVFQVLEELKEYLLYADSLLLSLEYLYLDADGSKVSFCYLPGYEKDSQQAVVDLMENLLPKVEHSDMEAVSIAYGVYRKVLESEWNLEEIKEALYGAYEEDVLSGKEPNEVPAEDEGPDLWSELAGVKEESASEQEPDSKKFLWKWGKNVVPMFVAAGVLLVLTGLRFYGFFPGMSLEFFLGILIVVIGIAGLVVSILSHKPGKTLPPPKEMPKRPDFRDPLPISEEMFREEVTEQSRFHGYDDEDDDSPCEETELLYHVRKQQPARLVPEDPNYPEIPLNREVLVIGKWKKTADICLEDPAVSRVHARIVNKKEQYYLADLNSRNGTLVNDILLKDGEEALLHDGDRITFAKVVYVFHERT